ncbi:MAG: imidazole glycerol phosphate synthase subunit HisF [Clostridiales Family XIII bacterium]|nr:imidazole glycerol phosphate synthase subunit HisF [Clostridiales Family XIII bacterium]
MLAKRIVPCLDVRDGRVVKGVNFVNIKDVGDPVECAMMYDRQGADEIVFLDITATHEGRGTMVDVVRRTAKNVFVPLSVGGGIRDVDDFRDLLRAGADKISVNSAAIRCPNLISQAASLFGSQCVVVAVDAKRVRRGQHADSLYCPPPPALSSDLPQDQEMFGYNVFVNGGRMDTGVDLLDWVTKAEELGAGEILLTSMDTDGTKTGFDLEMLKAVCSKVRIPVIASGGGGDIDDFINVFQKINVDAALAASIFHYGELTVGDIKHGLHKAGVPVR